MRNNVVVATRFLPRYGARRKIKRKLRKIIPIIPQVLQVIL